MRNPQSAHPASPQSIFQLQMTTRIGRRHDACSRASQVLDLPVEEAAVRLLEECSRFIEGFEGDESQDGLPELLVQRINRVVERHGEKKA